MEKDNRTQPTESQIKVLMSDWLGNLRMKDDGNYTHSGKGGIRRKKNETFSDYLIGDVNSLDQINLLKQGRIAAKQTVNAIVPEQTNVLVGGGTSFHASGDDGRHVINLATDYFDDNSLSSKEKIDIMLGLASHESAHAVFTDGDFWSKKADKLPAETKELTHTIWNILEDERIEYLLGDERPGLSQTLGAAKGYYFKKLVRDLRANGKMPTEPLPKLLAALTQAVRYPSEMTREDVVENFDQLDEIRKALTPYPLTHEEVWNATDRIMKIVRKTIEDEMDKQGNSGEQQSEPDQQPGLDDGQSQPQDSQNGQNDQDGNNQNGNRSPEQDDPNGEPQNQAQDQPQDQKKDQKDQNGKDDDKSDAGQSKPKKKHTEKEIRQAIKKALESEEGTRVMNAVKKDDTKSDSRNSASSISYGASSQTQFVNEDDAECSEGGPGDPRTFLFKPKGSADRYGHVLSRVRKYIPAMSKALACKSRDSDYVLKGLPYGKLNTNKLVSLRSGNTNIFEKKGSTICSSASVCMLIDESGSMSGQKEERAREAAVLVNETIARIKNVNFYCYGYTDDMLHVFAENGRTSKWALSDTGSYGGTPTGRAMKVASKRIRKFTSDPVLMLVLTDGSSDNNRLVMMMDQELRKDRIYPIGVGIQCGIVSSTFKEHVIINDISTFAVDLGRLTKGKLDKMLVRQSA